MSLHLSHMQESCERVAIATRPEWVDVVQDSSPNEVEVLGVRTQSMSQTIRRVLWNHGSTIADEWVLVGMPDTFFAGYFNPYPRLAKLIPRLPKDVGILLGTHSTQSEQRGHVGSVSLSPAGWVQAHADKNPDIDFGQHWGTLAFRSSLTELIDPAWPHIGYLIDPALHQGRVAAHSFQSEYFDCGTVAGYRSALAAAHT